MSSGFVSGGTIDAPIERDDEWLAAQKEIEDLRRKRAEESKQNDGRSLFEILEANKAAKQEAFEEANRLKNQFRSLDEDEIEFLDSVMESTRREEDKVKKETKEGLEAFRRQQELADKKLNVDTGSEEVGEEQWVTGPRKRKRARGEKEGLKGVKLRKSSSAGEQPAIESSPTTPGITQPPSNQSPKLTKPSNATEASTLMHSEPPKAKPETEQKVVTPASKPIGGGLALVGYGSDDDDD